jgi:hypothetical protein
VTTADEPFNVAVIVADWFETSVPVLTVKVAEVALAAALTEDGTVSAVEALLVSVTTVLLVVGFDRTTVQVVLALEGRMGALHRKEEIVIGAPGADNEIVAAADEPFSVPVIVADWFEASVPVLTVKFAEVVLTATLTEDGTVKRDGALLERETTVPVVVVLDRVTVHVVFALEDRLGALH